jgi:PD-(D/E)XK endonuclease
VIRFSTVSTRVNSVRTYIAPYDADQIDLFLIYCPDTGRVYALDVGEAASSNGRLRVDPTANGQARAFAGQPTMNCPPSSTGRALDL